MKQFNDYNNILFDRDGVINELIIRDNVIRSPRSLGEFTIRNDFKVFMKRLDGSKKCFVVTNQPEIKRGLLNPQILIEMHTMLSDNFPIIEIFVCLHDNDDFCSCRKPKPGMIISLLKKYKLRKDESVMIGDTEKDLLAAKNAGIDFVLLETSYNKHLLAKNSTPSLNVLLTQAV